MGGPEDVCGLAGPRIVRVTVQTMHQDQIDEGRAGGGGRVSFGQAITLDGDGWRALLQSVPVIDQPALVGEDHTYHHLTSFLLSPSSPLKALCHMIYTTFRANVHGFLDDEVAAVL